MALSESHLVKMGCPKATADKATAMGIPFFLLFTLLQQFGPKAVLLIEQIIAAWTATPTPVPVQAKAVAADCCDHACCCRAIVVSASATLDLACEHLCECCEPCA